MVSMTQLRRQIKIEGLNLMVFYVLCAILSFIFIKFKINDPS